MWEESGIMNIRNTVCARAPTMPNSTSKGGSLGQEGSFVVFTHCWGLKCSLASILNFSSIRSDCVLVFCQYRLPSCSKDKIGTTLLIPCRSCLLKQHSFTDFNEQVKSKNRKMVLSLKAGRPRYWLSIWRMQRWLYAKHYGWLPCIYLLSTTAAKVITFVLGSIQGSQWPNFSGPTMTLVSAIYWLWISKPHNVVVIKKFILGCYPCAMLFTFSDSDKYL